MSNNVMYDKLNFVICIMVLALFCLFMIFVIITVIANLYEKIKKQQTQKYDTSKILPEINWTGCEENEKDSSDDAING